MVPRRRRNTTPRGNKGLSTVEFALLLVLIIITGIAAWQTLGTSVSQRVDEVTNTIGATGSGESVTVENNAEVVDTTSDDTGTVTDDSESAGSQPEGIPAVKEPVAHGDE